MSDLNLCLLWIVNDYNSCLWHFQHSPLKWSNSIYILYIMFLFIFVCCIIDVILVILISILVILSDFLWRNRGAIKKNVQLLGGTPSPLIHPLIDVKKCQMFQTWSIYLFMQNNYQKHLFRKYMGSLLILCIDLNKYSLLEQAHTIIRKAYYSILFLLPSEL